MSDFIPRDHYWTVADDAARLWSSRAGSYVAADDAGYLVWQEAGGIPTRIANELELDQVLRQYDLSLGRAFTPAQALAALTLIDAARVKAALGRADLRPQDLVAGDPDKLRALAAELQPRARDASAPAPPAIEGATAAVTAEERLAKLEAKREEGELAEAQAK